MQKEIKNYKGQADQKRCLLGRIMLLNSLRRTGLSHLMHEWTKEQYGKPAIAGWDFFNIAHSGSYVLMSHGGIPLGIDIENAKAVDITAFDHILHHSEKEIIWNAPDKLTAFYDIWVKKEAFLKATGKGLSSALAQYNTAAGCIPYGGDEWYFHPLEIAAGYSACLCAPSDHLNCEVIGFDQDMLMDN
jgi:4'-phosphopantetheinyl transferase